MRKLRKFAAGAGVAVSALALMAIGAGSASAHTGEWAAFNNCPSTNPSAFKCLHSVTNGGSVKLGKKVVPIVNPVTLDGGVTEESFEEGPEEGFAHFVAAANGQTLSKTPQPVPGGLAGLVNCKEISNFIVRLACEAVFENGLTGVNATLELARPASEIRVSQRNLVFEEGIALEMPVKVHLENPFLGSGCYVGSSGSPLTWKLTTGTTSSPTPIKGTGGELSFTEEAQILHVKGTSLVDNTWTAPGASGCGGFGVELLLNPIINSMVGLPAGAGVNVSKLEKVNTDVALAEEVNNH